MGPKRHKKAHKHRSSRVDETVETLNSVFQITYEPAAGEEPRRLTAFAGFNVNGFYYKIWDADTLEILKTWPTTATTRGGM
jgi:hypothetical protein